MTQDFEEWMKGVDEIFIAKFIDSVAEDFGEFDWEYYYNNKYTPDAAFGFWAEYNAYWLSAV